MILIWLAAVLSPLIPLFGLETGFYEDWNNHLWLAGYYGKYFWEHGTFPLILNTQELSGIPYPLFYGNFFYQLVGLLSIPLGTGLALRLSLFAISSLVFWVVQSTVFQLSQNKNLSLATAVVWIWSIYPITNIFNRCAMPEYFAFSLLTCGVLWLFAISFGRSWSWRDYRIYAAPFCISAAAAFHPITALFGVSYFLPVAILIIILGFHRRQMILTGIAGALGFLAVVASFLYVYKVLGSEILISQVPKYMMILYDGSDWIWSRLSPIPFDPRIGTMAFDKISTPYLEAPINYSLLLIAFFLFRKSSLKTWPRNSRILFLVSLALGVFVLAASVNDVPWLILPSAFHWIQFAYRLVNYVNLSFLIAILSLLFLQKTNLSQKILLPILALSGVALTVKITHAFAVSGPTQLESFSIRGDQNDFAHFPDQFYGHGSYVTPRLYPFLMTKNELLPFAIEPLTVGVGKNFGQIFPMIFTLDRPQYLRTNLYPFVWNQVYLNGAAVLPYVTEDRITLALDPGQNRIHMDFKPPDAFLFWNSVSTVAFYCWLLLSIGMFCLPTPKRT